MTSVAVRRPRPGDGQALVRIHRDLASHYANLAPGRFQEPRLDGFAQELDAAVASRDEATLRLVAEVDGVVCGALVAQLLGPEPGAEREIAPDLAETRLRFEYVATDEAHRRGGIGTALVDAAEAWARERGATVAETETYHDSPLSMPFWQQRMGYVARSVNLRKRLDTPRPPPQEERSD